jgi:hypothetical protein
VTTDKFISLPHAYARERETDRDRQTDREREREIASEPNSWYVCKCRKRTSSVARVAAAERSSEMSIRVTRQARGVLRGVMSRHQARRLLHINSIQHADYLLRLYSNKNKMGGGGALGRRVVETKGV